MKEIHQLMQGLSHYIFTRILNIYIYILTGFQLSESSFYSSTKVTNDLANHHWGSTPSTITSGGEYSQVPVKRHREREFRDLPPPENERMSPKKGPCLKGT